MNTLSPSTPDLDILFNVVNRTWSNQPGYIEDLKLNYELAIDHFTALSHAHPTDERNHEIALHLVQALLLDYYLGCLLFKFVPTHAQTLPIDTLITGRQRTTEQLLARLAQFEVGRATMAAYFSAALEKQLHPLLRKNVKFRPTTFTQLLFQSLLPLLLAHDWEKLSEYGITFSLNGFSILYQALPETITPAEFDLLTRYLHRLALENRWTACTDVVHILTAAKLSPQQQRQLFEAVMSVGNVDLFPFQEYEENFPAQIEALHLSPLVKRFMKWSTTKTEQQLQERRRLNDSYRPIREYNSLVWCQEEVARMLVLLAPQNQDAVGILRQLVIAALKPDGGKISSGIKVESSADLVRTALNGMLLVSVTNVRALEIFQSCLATVGQVTLSDEQITALKESESRLTAESVVFLLDVIYVEANSCRWAEQMLENARSYAYEAIMLLTETASTDFDQRVLRILARWYQQNPAEKDKQIRDELESSLIQRFMELLFDPQVPLEDDWVRFLCNIANREPLRRILKRCARLLNQPEDASAQSRAHDILQTIASQASQLAQPDVVVLASCWLVAPSDRIQGQLSLHLRLSEAIDLISRGINEKRAERITQIFDAVLSTDEQSNGSIAQVLRHFAYPELAVPLLEKLMDMAIFNRDERLYEEAFKSLSSLTPLTPRTLQVLQDRLVLAYEIDYPILLTPKIVYDEVLPLLPKDVDPQYVELLIQMVWRCHCTVCGQTLPALMDGKSSWRLRLEELRHRYFHREPQVQEADESLLLCALQVLTNVSTLSTSQQQVIERIWRTSWLAPVKARALLILSCQQPASPVTLGILRNTLKTNPFVDCYTTIFKDKVRHWLFHWFNKEPPSRAHWGAIFISQSIAISALAAHSLDLNSPTDHPSTLIQSFYKLLSPVRYMVEQQLVRATANGGDVTNLAIAWLLGSEQKGLNRTKPVWVSRPSDVAYQALYNMLSQKKHD